MASTVRETDIPVALVGISCRLPGSANSVDELWDLLKRGGESWTPVPSDRFNQAAFHHPSADDPNGTSNHQGGHFIDGDVRDFDHSFFRISPQQAAAMDPQQRILLEMSYEALENAGWLNEDLTGTSTAVYVADFTADFNRNLYKDTLDLPTYYATGAEKAILANRISYHFDLRGPSITLNTACSGGLVAMHQACRSLRDGESTAAIVAAANLTLGPDHHIGMSNMHLISGTGRSYPFDIRGEGYGRGEGFVVFALKRLDHALRDRDPVRAIICGTAVNQDGYTPAGITHPNGKAQADLIRTAYAMSGLKPEDIAYVEAHGTGTDAGDREELAALADVFTSSARAVPLYVGSIKGNIGHTENTSGLASVLKAVLILEHKLIPPVAGFSIPKPGLPLDQMRIPDKLISWPHIDGVVPRISINSFGFGGTNCHAILEQGPRAPPRTSPDRRARVPRLFMLSAYSRLSLAAMIKAHHEWLDSHPDVDLADLSYTLCHRRSRLPWRFSCVADDRSSLLNKLHQGLSTTPRKPASSVPSIMFVFTGQGAQWAGMGRELLANTTLPNVFRDSLRTSRGILCTELGAKWDLETELLRDATSTLLNTAELAQPATTAVQIALVELLRSQGIRPQIVVGHSSGEIAGAYAAGYISHRAALEIAYHRGRVSGLSKLKGLPHGAMMSVGLSESEVAPYCNTLTKGVASIACVNSPTNVTISGDSDAVDELATRLRASSEGTFLRRLVVDTAYHSYHMQAVAEDYRASLGKLQAGDVLPGSNDVTFISSVTGTHKSSCFNSEYWTTNLVSPVRFCDAIQTLARDEAARGFGRPLVFIEIGPHPALAGPVRQTLAQSSFSKLEFDYYSVLQRKVCAVTSALTLASNLFEHSMKLVIDAVSTLSSEFQTANMLTDLPSYPWDHSTKHWHESRVSFEYRMRKDPYHDLLGVRVADSTTIEPRWRHMVSISTLPWLSHHVVDGLVIFPGSGYLCMAVEAVRQLCREYYPLQSLETIALDDITFLRALVIPEPPQRTEVQLSLKLQSGKEFAFAFSISALSDGAWHEHCRGVIEGVLFSNKNSGPEEVSPLNGVESVRRGLNLGSIELYRELVGAGNEYGPTFASIKSLTMASDLSQATAEINVSDTAATMPAQHQEPHLIHPSTLDAIFHTALPLVGRRLGAGAVMPVHIDELLLSVHAMAMVTSPGDRISVSTKVTSGEFRTMYSGISALAGNIPILSASGIELRSLGQQIHRDGSTGKAGICYELEWKPDIDHLRPQDLPSNPGLSDVVSYICFKNAKLAVLELGGGRGDLSTVFLNAVSIHQGQIGSYDFVDSTSALFDDAQRQLHGHSIHYRTMDPVANPVAQGFKPQHYDVVMVSKPEYARQTGVLLSTGGMLILNSLEDTWLTASRGASIDFESKLVVCDEGQYRQVAFPIAGGQGPHLSHNIQILTRSPTDSPSSWTTMIAKGLRDLGNIVSLESLGTGSTRIKDDHYYVIVDDEQQSMLSDRDCFTAVIALLRQPVQIIWLSLDEPSSMHQITGIARTAHAENDDLRLITIHASSTLLGQDRILQVLSSCVSRSLAGQPTTDWEREYRITGDGTVLIPRVRRSERLNRAIQTNDDLPETELRRFRDSTRPLVLSLPRNDHTTTEPLFVEDETAKTTPLGIHEVEIETEAFVLSKSRRATGLGEFAGNITRIGANVKGLSLGDSVVALGSTIGASHPRISIDRVGHIKGRISPSTAVAYLMNLISASYSLHTLARLQPTEVILIHGASSANGRATVAVARAIGAHVMITASSLAEAKQLEDQLGVRPSDIFISRRSPRRQSPRDVYAGTLDAIVLASSDSVPIEILGYLRPFTCIISMSQTVQDIAKFPPNTTFHHFNIVELLQACPDLINSLMEKTSVALEYLPVSDLEPYTRDISQVSEALRLVRTGAYDQITLRAGADSIVPTAMQPGKGRFDWGKEDASYVLAGGLGDLGRRLLILMARRGAKFLVTLSRRAISTEDYHELQAQLQAILPGCILHCLKCDITSEVSVRNAAKNLIRMGVPPVRGVIQSAVILQDRTLESMTYDDFLLASQVKVEGTHTLERVFASPHLEFLLMLSSAVNIVGASGQANYNAGNSVQDAMAQNGRNVSYHLISLNIGWIEDAIHTADNNARLTGLRRSGLRAVSHEELSRYFDYILGTINTDSRMAQAIIGFDAMSLAQATARNSNIYSAMFRHVREEPSNEQPLESTETTHSSFQEVLSIGSASLAVDFITNAMTTQLAKLIATDVNRVRDHEGSILGLGLDSLVAIELRNWLMREFDAPLQSSELMIDQPIRALAEKVAARSRIASSVSANTSSSEVGSEYDGEKEVMSPITNMSASADLKVQQNDLPPLGFPTLEETLHLFQESRCAIDPLEDQKDTITAIQEFLGGQGPLSQQRVEESTPSDLAEIYDRQIYLERREPLQDYSEYTVGHALDAPAHSQAERAAIVTTAAVNYSRRLSTGNIAPDTVHGMPVNTEARNWLFYATRKPGLEKDCMERYAPSQNVAVLRRGHVFQLMLPDPNMPIHLPAVLAAYIAILEASEEPQLSICTLTADERSSWTMMRNELELDPNNSATLAAIDAAAFVVCLDDEAPQSPGERHVQYLWNGCDHPLTNRWLDKTVQFVVTANGLSAGVYEHTKIDALDVRSLHKEVVDALFDESSGCVASFPSTAYPIHEHTWKPSPTITRHVELVKQRCSSYGPIDHQTTDISSLGMISLGNTRASPHATAHLTVLLAVYLVDGAIRPAWEIVSLSTFAHGRLDWVQTVSSPVRTFIEAVANGNDSKACLRSLFDAAAMTYSQAISSAARGCGFVNHMYALLGVVKAEERENASEIPSLFRTAAWNATRRGGPGQDLKIGFMPDEDPAHAHIWDEGGFLVDGDRGTYVHCTVREHHTSFSVFARPAYATVVGESLQRAAAMIAHILMTQ
ncbi:polyketide synthase [Annulohypoxylon truncatum]|uniref:polyketide synthase n=1 Tax=Annulohypoxylon truncatum TaxID=327061 RepID=UPI0020075D7E|nr:polyketide synthase [Annulohypoxylon truncatum]KAI1212191.1 polyketide synthase [Annulohypoxylon truncatum]